MLSRIKYIILLLALYAQPAFAISTVSVMADSTISVTVADLARSYARDKAINVNTSFIPATTQEEQITEGGAGDILITPNQEWIETLRTKGLVDINTQMPIAKDQLVLVSPLGSTLSMPNEGFPTAQIISAIQYEQAFALGNPEVLPEGKFAKESLRNLGASGDLEPYTVYIKERETMFDLVSNHQAYGVFFLSSVIGRSDVRLVGKLPQSSHSPITYYAVVVAGDNMDEARKFMDYLKTPEAKEVLKNRGFLTD